MPSKHVECSTLNKARRKAPRETGTLEAGSTFRGDVDESIARILPSMERD